MLDKIAIYTFTLSGVLLVTLVMLWVYRNWRKKHREGVLELMKKRFHNIKEALSHFEYDKNQIDKYIGDLRHLKDSILRKLHSHPNNNHL